MDIHIGEQGSSLAIDNFFSALSWRLPEIVCYQVTRHHFVESCWDINHHGWFAQASWKGRSLSLNVGEQAQGTPKGTFLYSVTVKSFPIPLPYFPLITFCVHVCVLNRMRIHCGTREGQRTSCGNWFSPSTMWVPRTELTQVVRLGSECFYQLSFLNNLQFSH